MVRFYPTPKMIFKGRGKGEPNNPKSARLLRQVEPVVVAGAEGGVALWTLSLPGLVSGPEAVVAKAVEAFGQHRVFSLHFARRTRQRLLVFSNLLLQYLKGKK